MKTRLFWLAALLLCLGTSARAVTIIWTNTAGGNWSVANNWNPNQAPGSSDNAVITNNGTYLVTLDTNVTVANLTLGGSSDQQTLTTSGKNLTVNSASAVNANGIIQLNGGGVFGNLAVTGQLVWISGQLGSANVGMTVATNGLLVLAGVNGTDYVLGQYLTNAGTIFLQSGNLDINWSAYNGNLINSSGGLVDIQADVSVDNAGNSLGFVNQGTVRKSGGTGITSINPIFNNTGKLDVQTGTVKLTGGGSGGGQFTTAEGTTLIFANSYQATNISGAGTNLFTGGAVTLSGNLTTSNNILAGGILTGPGFIRSSLVWNSGTIGNGSSGMTIATNATLVLAGANGTSYTIGEYLTNAGTIFLKSGNLLIDWSTYYGNIINLPGGLVDVQADCSIYNAGNSLGLFNQGTVRKSGGTGTTAITATFGNSGTLDVQSGTVIVNGGTGNGQFNTASGTTLMFTNGYTVTGGGSLNGAGTNIIVSGTFALAGSLSTSNTVLAGGVLMGNNGTISGQLTWTNGVLGNGSGSMTVATNGVLVLAGVSGANYTMGEYLTNAGTIFLKSGNLLIDWATYYGNVINLPGGLVDLQADVSITNAGNSLGFVNRGTLRKSGGNGTSAINPTFNNSGTLSVQTGAINLNGSYTLTGGTLNFGINSLANFGKLNLTNVAGLTGTVTANLNNGYVPIGGNIFTVLTCGSANGIFTNTSLPFADAWQTNYTATNFSLQVLNARPVVFSGTIQVDELTLLSSNVVADYDAPAQTLTFSLVSGPAGMSINPGSGVINWTPAQTQSPSTNIVVVSATDNGTPALSGTNSFTVIVREVNVAPVLPVIASTNVNELTLLTVTNTASESNIHSTITGYGLVNPPAGMVISSNGVITWTPSQTQSPATNLITTVVTNSNPFDLVNPVLTSTNTFTVIVKEVNVAPSLPTFATQVVNELTLLTVNDTATNFNIHSSNIGYTLLNPPVGMGINTNGVVTWIPSQTQSPGTNLITVTVTNSNPFDLVNPNLTATNSFTVIVKEVNVAPTLPTVSTQIVNELALLTVTNTATNANIHSTITGYLIVNPPGGMSINPSGIITWTPSQAQSPGTNLITTIVTNTNPYDAVNPSLTSTNTFTVVVKEVNVPPTLPVISTQFVNELALLTVTNTATNPNIHSSIAGYALVNPPLGMSISASGIITWTPSLAQSPGTNLITTIVTNSNPYDAVNPSLISTNIFTVIVYAPTLAALGNYTINAGQTLTFTASATDNDSSRILTFSLVNPPSGAGVNSASGLFNWRPTVAQANSTNLLQMRVTDNSVPALTDTKSFSVIVNPLSPVVLTPLGYAGGQFVLKVNGTAGPDYILSTSTNLTVWSDLLTNLSPATPFQFTNASSANNRFYRVRLAP
jgi:hypothetical protein